MMGRSRDESTEYDTAERERERERDTSEPVVD
jgi:hypothetical protein